MFCTGAADAPLSPGCTRALPGAQARADDGGMPRPPSPLPPDLGRVFTCAQAVASGATERRLRARDLTSPFRGVRVRQPGPRAGEEVVADDGPLSIDRAQRVRVERAVEAYVLVMPAEAFICGRTAAILWGAPLAAGIDIDVGVRAPARAIRRAGVRGRKVAPHLVDVIDAGCRISSPASTWAMLGSELDVRDLVRIGDAFVRVPRDGYGRPQHAGRLATIAQLRDAASAGRRVGGAKLTRALQLIRVGAMSPLETDLRLGLREARLPEPVLDVEIRDERGMLLGIADAAYPEQRVLIEIEGDHHRTDRAQWNRDIDKHRAYAAAGWDVVRLTGWHVRGDRYRAPALVRDALVRGGWDGRSTASAPSV